MFSAIVLIMFIGTGCTEWKVQRCVKDIKAEMSKELMECLQEEDEFVKLGCAIGSNIANEEMLEGLCRHAIREKQYMVGR